MNKGVIDIGNTRIKSAIFNAQGEITKLDTFQIAKNAVDWLKSNQVDSIFVSSVSQKHSELEIDSNIQFLRPDSILPFKNLYKSQETLGLDRIAAMAAASVLYPNQAVLVFDIGTCMTIDFLYPDNSYKGGNISPGIEMRLNSMHTMTGRLPLAAKDMTTPLMGDSTHSALATGAMLGMKYEIEGYLNEFSKKYPNLIAIGCGGDFMYFDIPSKYKIFAAPNFVLYGLYHLLLLNEK
ncbi:MAG: type III pantothenate kinase [Bacteroidia bacterium]